MIVFMYFMGWSCSIVLQPQGLIGHKLFMYTHANKKCIYLHFSLNVYLHVRSGFSN